MTVLDARREAESRSLDLIEVAPQSQPPVCRIMDYGKFRYEQQKKLKDGRKKAKQVEIKVVRLRPNTDDHDIAFKMRNCIRFLAKGNIVRFIVIFRGPELRHKEIGEAQLKLFVEACKTFADVEMSPRMEGRRMTMSLTPKAGTTELAVAALARLGGKVTDQVEGPEETEAGDEGHEASEGEAAAVPPPAAEA
jgi:translation initiation factor IF-3